MYRRILVPLDGSTTAEQVIPYVRSGAGLWALGTVTERVVRHDEATVLVLRTVE